ncbi:MAG: radical SAM protein [Candidatus Omnitrophica bacterium]|nr:radical SAM protein [Candidatus Omnitrophota bacterium]MBU1928430.1 radical SAM protein [Candidatus Omnitrophota bacterium]MBU2034312.1 radical SAM protein [Candidatus Omnitrophota bacterium]MBU2221904.1 radical SAM protein [Candidatus Omnitrophota bacterium]
MKLNIKKKNIFLAGANDAFRQLVSFSTFGINSKPQRVDIRINHKCNLRCGHCLQRHEGEELVTEDWKAVIMDLKKWLGCFPLVITGGEPLLRQDLFEIIYFSFNLGLVTMLNTNGSLINSEVADKLERSGLDIIALSLDGFQEKTHDSLRGPGAYANTMGAIAELKGRIRTQINTVITGQNLAELLDLIEFSERNGLGISFQGLICKGYDGKNISALADNGLFPQDKDRISREFDRIIERKKKSPYIRSSTRYLLALKSYYLGLSSPILECRAYDKAVTILPDGAVKICWLSDPIGNISSTAIDDIWRSEETRLKRKEMRKCKSDCSFLSCFFRENNFEKIQRYVNTFFIKT